MMDDLPVQVVRLQEQMKAVQADVVDIRTDQKAQLVKLDRLLELDQQRKGAAKATRALFAVLGSGGFLAAAGWAWEHFTRHP